MFLYDPTGTIFRVIIASLLAGAALAIVAVCLIYIGSVRLAPRIPPARIWADWRRKRMIWGLSLMLTAITQVLLVEWLGRKMGLIDLYWAGRPEALLWITRLAGTCGYLLVMLLTVVVSLIRQRMRSGPRRPRLKQ